MNRKRALENSLPESLMLLWEGLISFCETTWPGFIGMLIDGMIDTICLKSTEETSKTYFTTLCTISSYYRLLGSIYSGKVFLAIDTLFSHEVSKSIIAKFG